MKTLSDCISALSRVKHLLTDPEAGPCVDGCAATIELALQYLDGLECEQKIAAMEEPKPVRRCHKCGRPFELFVAYWTDPDTDKHFHQECYNPMAYERFGQRLATGV